MALWRDDHYGHPIEPDPIHHCNARSHYTSVKYTASLPQQRHSASLSSAGDADDNAPAESIIKLFQTKVANQHGPFKTLAETKYAPMQG